MLGTEEFDRFRRMSPAERLALYQVIMDGVWKMWRQLPPEEVQRRLDASAALNDLSNEAMMRELLERDRR